MDPYQSASTPLVPPLMTAAVYRIADLDAVDALYEGKATGYIYARDAHPNARHLAGELSKLHSADWTCVTASGMAALSLAFVAYCSPGDRIVASDRLYGRTNKLLREEIPRLGVFVDFVDTNDLPAVAKALETPAKMLVAETISNPTMRVAPIRELAARCKATGTKLLVDNTFATPILCRPLELGADIAMESLTKQIGGHSDVTLGSISGKGDDGNRLASLMSTWGWSANPFDCWMTLRGLETLELRAKASSENAGQVAAWLAEQPGVLRVLHPSLPHHPDRAISVYLNEAFGHMLAFEVVNGRAGVNAFMRAAPGIPFCPSLGHTGTTCSHPCTTSHRFEPEASRAAQGITSGLIRLSVGIASVERIQAELAKGLTAANRLLPGNPPACSG